MFSLNFMHKKLWFKQSHLYLVVFINLQYIIYILLSHLYLVAFPGKSGTWKRTSALWRRRTSPGRWGSSEFPPKRCPLPSFRRTSPRSKPALSRLQLQAGTTGLLWKKKCHEKLFIIVSILHVIKIFPFSDLVEKICKFFIKLRHNYSILQIVI